MSNAELVMRLARERDDFTEGGSAWRLFTDAITALSAQDEVRDGALAKVAAMCILRADELNDTRSAYDAVAGAELMAMAERIRALKSKPAWTRKDGNTTPRTGPEDRRKSAYGIGNTGAGRSWRRLTQAPSFGRRADDYARWTKPAAPVVECPDCADPSIKFSSKCAAAGHYDTPPAQEAPQSLEGWTHERFVEDRCSSGDYVTFHELKALAAKIDELRELDRRMGGK